MNNSEESLQKQKKATFGVVFLTIFMDMVGFSVIFPLFPSMLDHYLTREAALGGGLVTSFVDMVKGYGYKGVEGSSFRLETVIFGGALGSLYAILQFVFAPIWGRYSDRVGRRSVLLLTLGGTCLGYGLWIFAGSFWVLVLSRTIGGIASGNLSVATAAIADVTSRKDRSKGMAIVGIAFGLGFVLGPALGGIASSWDWSGDSSSAFALTPFSLAASISFCLALLNWGWLAKCFRETLPEERRGKDSEKPRPAIFQLKRVANPAVRKTCLSYLCYMVSFSGMEFTLTFLAVERYAYQPKDITSMFLLIGFTLIFAQGFIVRRFVGKIGEKNMALQGILLGVLAFILLALPSSETWFFFALFLMSCGVAFISPTLTALTSLHSSEEDQGFNLGIFRSSGSLARALGPILAGLAYYLSGSTFAYSAGAFLLLIPFLILIGVPKPSKDEPVD
jgi:MFS family permease